MRSENLADAFAEIRKLKQDIRDLATASPLGNSSVSRGSTRFIGNESLLVEGSQKVSGWLVVTGTLKVVGTFLLEGLTTITGTLKAVGSVIFEGPFSSKGTTRFEGDTTQVGPFHITGDTNATGAFTSKGTTRLEGDTTQVGAHHVQGNQDITGALAVKGNATLENNLSLVGGGRIEAGAMSITSSGNIVSTTGIILDPTGQVAVQGDLAVTGTFSSASKTFKIPHPIKDDTWLFHGVTESDVHGVEYWGEGTLDINGVAVVQLPDYFEALTSAEGRAVLVTGRQNALDWSDIANGAFSVTGQPGTRFSWLVKAARGDVRLVVEQPVESAEDQPV